jgi:glyoxylase-like metal-dependent hydrolase (beta-lactamase superfamily II)
MKVVLFLVLFASVLAGGFAMENDGIFTMQVGQFEVTMLVESEREGSTAIIPSAGADILARNIPAAGFRHTANAFLVRSPSQTILVDAGTGAGGVLLNKLQSIGVEPANVDTILITHLHGDHFGGLHQNGRALFPNARVYLSRLEHDHFTRIAPNENAVRALNAYGARLQTFDPAPLTGNPRELLPGITPIAAYNHTPGHTVFLVESNGQKLLIIGDLLHVALVQFPHPEISATFDMDPQGSAAIRRQILSYAAANRIPVGGMHIVYPGIGNVEAAGNGFRFTPLR